MLLHYLACKGGAISLIRVQVNSLIREFQMMELLYKQVTNAMRLNPIFDHKSFKFDTLNTFLLIRELKQVTPLLANWLLPYKQCYVVISKHFYSYMLYKKKRMYEVCSYVIFIS
ncbi:Hypothetical_protein [Hexamita inflata]|uniref:Hypothetical_protein n=1 Tax=Hexamita inflata TaxID=28002 RepID=A0AA86TAE4_9EUKA|nr:Hypothetical protein HINF_LOCUS1184 [Hexamita inflata]